MYFDSYALILNIEIAGSTVSFNTPRIIIQKILKNAISK